MTGIELAKIIQALLVSATTVMAKASAEEIVQILRRHAASRGRQYEEGSIDAETLREVIADTRRGHREKAQKELSQQRAVIELARAFATAEGSSLSQQDATRLTGFISEEKSFLGMFKSFFAESTDQEVLIVGPSGAGKTELWRSLVSYAGAEPLSTTRTSKADDVNFGGRHIRVVDTPGDLLHNTQNVVENINSGKAKIIIIVLAFGYLEDINFSGLRRPGVEREFNDIDSYLQFARAEEVQWMQNMHRLVPTLQRHADHCIVLINKRDLWHDDANAIRHYYCTRNLNHFNIDDPVPTLTRRTLADSHAHDGSATNPVANALLNLVGHWSADGAFSFQMLANRYNSFLYERAPSAFLSDELVMIQQRLFRAQLALQFAG